MADKRNTDQGTLDEGTLTEQSRLERADTFLSRWSHRKQEAQGGAQPPKIADQDPASEALDRSIEHEPPALTDADMPPLESLDQNSDYSGFMSPKVSDQLRRLALRKMFQGPQFNIRDGLDDYDEDFTRFEPLGDIVTADLRHRMERLASHKEPARTRKGEREPRVTGGAAEHDEDRETAEIPQPAEKDEEVVERIGFQEAQESEDKESKQEALDDSLGAKVETGPGIITDGIITDEVSTDR